MRASGETAEADPPAPRTTVIRRAFKVVMLVIQKEIKDKLGNICKEQEVIKSDIADFKQNKNLKT